MERGYGYGWTASVILLFAACGTAAAQNPDRPRVHTNEAYVEEATQPSTLAIKDKMAVFAFVLDSLPERVKVYPTENYYYFKFVHDGTPYAGNLRFGPPFRDQGKVQFAYFPELTDWKDEVEGGSYGYLDASDGVKVERVEPLVYRVTYRQKAVTFALNDLSQVKPPPAVIGPDEKYLGPIFDESGIRFFLVYNPKLKIFLYILDETVKVGEDLSASKRTDRIQIGRRTGFAYYRDHRLERKILIATFETNSRVNNYFDGPFDQLPENFVDWDDVVKDIVASDPSAKGKLDKFGFYRNDSGRYPIHPYRLYQTEDQLFSVHRCATGKLRSDAYYRCFVAEP